MSTPLKYITHDIIADTLRSNPESISIVDVRDMYEFEEGHIKGAKVYPSENFECQDYVTKILEENADKRIIVHCFKSQQRGPMCARILNARAKQLVEQKINDSVPEIVVLHGGFENFQKFFGDDISLVNKTTR